MREALVVAEVEIGLRAIVGDENFAVLERAHGARIDVQIRIELLQRDLAVRGFRADSRWMPPRCPLPSDETTPPVTKMYLAIVDMSTSYQRCFKQR